MFAEDKITEIFVMEDEFCKDFYAMLTALSFMNFAELYPLGCALNKDTRNGVVDLYIGRGWGIFCHCVMQK